MTNRAWAGWRVWTVTQTKRTLRDAPADSGAAVKLAAAGNEWESFQILMRSDADVSGINVQAGDLKGPNGSILHAEDALLFRQHQLHLTVGTSRNHEFKPGWYPDPLIPFRHPSTRKPLEDGELVAIPFNLPADETHGFWVDVYVPADASPGEYRGIYRVTTQGGRAMEIPVTLTVWAFALPRVSTLQTFFGSPALQVRRYYHQLAGENAVEKPTDWDMVEIQCAEMLAQHRINALLPAGSVAPAAQSDGSYRIPSEQVNRLREFVDRNHFNAIRIEHPSRVVKDPELEREKLHAWLRSWDRASAELNRPHIVFYTYLRDEPNDEEGYEFVRKWGKAIREAGSVVKVLVVEQTWPEKEEWGDLYGAVDIWCPLFPKFREESAAKRQTLGETIWTYTALCQKEPTPWWHIDYPLLNYRVPTWISWRYGIRGLLYWSASFWRQVEDPWLDPKTLDRRDESGKGTIYNGEGTIVYPGIAVGHDGIVPSLRLKALRDGIEDYEYLAMLEQAGLAVEAQEMIMSVAGSWFHWEEDPAVYQRVRARLADMIVAAR